MAVKNDNVTAGMQCAANITHQNIVADGIGGCKIGTETTGASMSNIIFNNVDVISGIRGIVIDALDTAVITCNTFENIRIEYLTGDLIDLDMTPVTYRTAALLCTVTNTILSNITCDLIQTVEIEGVYNSNSNTSQWITGVNFYNFTINGTHITNFSSISSFGSLYLATNQYITNINFY
jgi:hypothetical protein